MPKCRITLEIDFDLLPDDKLVDEFLEGIESEEHEGEPIGLDEYKALSRAEFEVRGYAEAIAENMDHNPDGNVFFFAGSDLDHEIKGVTLVSAEIIAT